jgi:hypothetical protein
VRETLDNGRDREDPEQGLAEEGEVRGRRFDRRAGEMSRFHAGGARAGGEDHGDGPCYDGGFEAEALEAGAEDRGEDGAEEAAHAAAGGSVRWRWSSMFFYLVRVRDGWSLHDPVGETFLLVEPFAHVSHCWREKHTCADAVQRSKAYDELEWLFLEI